MTIERYEHVMHIVSEVIGELKPHLSPYERHRKFATNEVLSQVHLNLELENMESYPYKREVSIGWLGISTVIII